MAGVLKCCGRGAEEETQVFSFGPCSQNWPYTKKLSQRLPLFLPVVANLPPDVQLS